MDTSDDDKVAFRQQKTIYRPSQQHSETITRNLNLYCEVQIVHSTYIYIIVYIFRSLLVSGKLLN